VTQWFEGIKADIVDRLENMEGREIYLCDLGFELTMEENVNGSWYCSRARAWEEIAAHVEEYGEVAEYMRDNFEDNTNALLEPELFHVKAMIAIYEQTFNAAVSDFDEWNEEITIDAAFIDRVREALEDVDFNTVF